MEEVHGPFGREGFSKMTLVPRKVKRRANASKAAIVELLEGIAQYGKDLYFSTTDQAYWHGKLMSTLDGLADQLHVSTKAKAKIRATGEIP